MTVFYFIAAALVLTAIAFVLAPLLRRPRGGPQSVDTNLSVYRDQFAELERDLRLGTLDNDQYESARAELQRRLLDDVGNTTEGGKPKGGGNRLTALTIAVAIPVLAGLLYWHLGTPQGIGAAKHATPSAEDLTVEQFQQMTEKLAARMASNPDDAQGWMMLGRAYKALQKFPEAVKALQEANKRKPGDAQVLVEYAEALAQVNGKLDGEPRALLEQALKIAPDDPRALTMAGGAAFEAGDYAIAVARWEHLSKLVPADSELGQALATGLAKAREAASGKPVRSAGTNTQSGAEPGATEKSAVADKSKRAAPAQANGARVSGQVKLADALKDKVKPDDTVFIFARAAQGPRMPVAIVRKQVKDLPTEFQLDDSMAMNPQMKLSSVGDVVVTARVSRSGSAMPASGDLQGETAPLQPNGAKVAVIIDRILP